MENVMKKYLVQTCLIGVITSIPLTSQAQNVWWNVTSCGADIMEMMVNVATNAPTTYYETLGWNFSDDASGYTGIQTTNNGPSVIFSMWNPVSISNFKPISAPYVNPNGAVTPFNSEGSGLGYINYKINWQPNSWYREVVRSWQYNGDTYFGLWFYDIKNKIWSHQVTMDYPMPNKSFCNNTSFMENYTSTQPTLLRHADYTGGWQRLNAQWIPIYQSYVVGNLTQYDTEIKDTYSSLVMQTGIATKNVFPQLHINFANLIPPFTLTSNNYLSSQSTQFIGNKVIYNWTVSAAVYPQFSYKIELVDKSTHNTVQTISDINPETRSVTFNNVTIPSANVMIVATITDLYDIAHSNSGW